MSEVIEQKEVALPDMSDKLEGVLFQFIDLYDKVSAEKLQIQDQASRMETMGKALQETQKELKKTQEDFAKLSNVVKNQLAANLQHVIANLEKKMDERIEREVRINTEESTQGLNKASHEATKTLMQYESKLIGTGWKTTIMAIACSVFSAWMVAKFMIPNYPLSDSALRMLGLGAGIEDVWPKLSKKEQQQIKQKAGKNSPFSQLQ